MVAQRGFVSCLDSERLQALCVGAAQTQDSQSWG
jgi:hypothetical protein